MVRNFKRSLTFLVILILVTATYAFAAANTVPTTNAGYGKAVVSGYQVTNVLYNAPTTPLDPTKVATVTFTLIPDGANKNAPEFVYINLTTTPAWIECTGMVDATGDNWDVTCTPGLSVLVASITTLDIVATNSDNPYP